MEQRLQKLLASAGVASRRSSEELIARGKVTVNGLVVTEMGAKADPEKDDIRVFGKPLAKDVERLYILLNKPLGYVSTVKDRHAERTVMQLVKGLGTRLYPVGRLDADSAGLLILSNDGDFTKLLTHPSHEIPKTYRSVVRGKVLAKTIQQLARGIDLEDGMTAPAEIQIVDYDSANNAAILDVTIHEGRNRQIRRMFMAVHHPVLALTRIQIGPLQLRGLPPGKWRKLHPSEINQLIEMAETPSKVGKARPKPSEAAKPVLEPVKRVNPRNTTVAKPPRRTSIIPPETAAARDAAFEITRNLRRGDERPERKESPKGIRSAGRNRRAP